MAVVTIIRRTTTTDLTCIQSTGPTRSLMVWVPTTIRITVPTATPAAPTVLTAASPAPPGTTLPPELPDARWADAVSMAARVQRAPTIRIREPTAPHAKDRPRTANGAALSLHEATNGRKVRITVMPAARLREHAILRAAESSRAVAATAVDSWVKAARGMSTPARTATSIRKPTTAGNSTATAAGTIPALRRHTRTPLKRRS